MSDRSLSLLYGRDCALVVVSDPLTLSRLRGLSLPCSDKGIVSLRRAAAVLLRLRLPVESSMFCGTCLFLVLLALLRRLSLLSLLYALPESEGARSGDGES